MEEKESKNRPKKRQGNKKTKKKATEKEICTANNLYLCFCSTNDLKNGLVLQKKK